MNIFCDLDGTLVDMSVRHYQVYSDLIEKYGGHSLGQAEYWKAKRQKVSWALILEKSSIPSIQTKEFMNDFIERIESPNYLALDTLFPGVKSALATLQNQHSLFLVSLRRKPDTLFKQVEQLGIQEYFEEVLTGHSESDGSDIKSKLITPYRGTGAAAIIGDTEADVLTGKQLQLQTIAVVTGIRSREFLAGLNPDALAETFTDASALLTV